MGLTSWLLVYGERDYNSADRFFTNLRKAKDQLGVDVKEPEYCEVKGKPSGRSFSKAIEGALQEWWDDGVEFQFVAVIIPFENMYNEVKLILNRWAMPSQVVRAHMAKNADLSVSSNVLRQITAKIGGVPWSVASAPAFKNSMIVGIDVCHSGTYSYVGFAASYNGTMSKYFSLVRKQKKGQELITDSLVECFTKALEFYQSRNKALPKQIIVYRDGVGDSQRAQVMETEFPQLIKAMKSVEPMYNPSIVIMIVNKRIA